MELKEFVLLMWRNIRYILLGIFFGASVGILAVKIQVPVYEATTQVYVSRTRQQSNADMVSLSDEQLLAINLQLLKSRLILDEVISQLGSKVNPDDIAVGVLPNSLILQIKVSDNDPQQAATIANLLVQVLIEKNGALVSGWYEASENSITEQLALVQEQMADLQIQISQINDASIREQLIQVNQQINQLKTEISTIEQDIASFPESPTPIEVIELTGKHAKLDQIYSLLALYQEIQTNLTYIGKPVQNGLSLENPQLETLQSTLDLYEQINISLIESRENVHLAGIQSRQNVMQIVPAIPPKNQIRPIPNLYILLGSVVGLALAATTILMIDHMDVSLRSASQVEELLGLPVLGSVLENKKNKNRLVTMDDPFSAEADAFRTLGASIEIIGARKNIRTLMVLNVEPADPRTTLAANLAVINAQQGKKVVLLDGDIKHPHLHNLFGIENEKGVSELLNNTVYLNSACHIVENVEGITLIPGSHTENAPGGWMNAEKLGRVFSKLQEDADLVVVDGPSTDAADAQVLASIIDAVLLVTREGRTRVDVAQAAIRRFQLIGDRVAGIVLIRPKPHQKIDERLSTWFKKQKQMKKKPAEVDSEIDPPVIPLS